MEEEGRRHLWISLGKCLSVFFFLVLSVHEYLSLLPNDKEALVCHVSYDGSDDDESGMGKSCETATLCLYINTHLNFHGNIRLLITVETIFTSFFTLYGLSYLVSLFVHPPFCRFEILPPFKTRTIFLFSLSHCFFRTSLLFYFRVPLRWTRVIPVSSRSPVDPHGEG